MKRCSFVAFSHYPVSDPYFPSSIIHIIFTHYLTTYCFTGQGRCTDLIRRRTSNHSSTLTLNPKDTSPSAIVTKSGSVFVGMTSDSDLYHHRNTSNVSSGASCPACTQQRLSPSDSHTCDYISTGIPPWVCVSKSSHLPLVALNARQLHILNKIYLTLLVIAAIVEQGRSS